MPIKVTKYRCANKCGKRAIASKKDMYIHEESYCVLNPNLKTCETCSNKLYCRSSEGSECYRGCKIDELDQFFQDYGEYFRVGNSKTHVKAMYNCPNHNLLTLHPETESFINLHIDAIGKTKETDFGLPF